MKKVALKHTLSPQKKRAIIAEFASGKSARDVASKFGISHTAVLELVRAEPDYTPSITLRKFRTLHMSTFLAMIDAGVTPEIAAAVFGVSKAQLEELRQIDPDFRLATDGARYANLAEAEKTLHQAAISDWRAALERLTRAKETREYWKSSDKLGGIAINVTMDWDREPSGITIDMPTEDE